MLEVCKLALLRYWPVFYMKSANKQETYSETQTIVYLANIQRNGTYSVVPRVAAGELPQNRLLLCVE